MPVSASTGISSGLDYAGLLDQLVKIQREPIRQLEEKKDVLESRSSAYESLSTKLNTLKSAAEALSDTKTFVDYSATSTDENILKVTADSTASDGVYSIVVSNLAQSHKMVADGVATEDTVIAAGAGSFKFTVAGGAEETVSVDATTTLADLRDAVNALDAGVTATVVNDGSGATPYRLILTSDTTGASNAIVITQDDTTLTGTFADIQAAQDASLTVDGLAISRSTNTITDIITGVTLDLNSADVAKTVTVEVNKDTDVMKTKVQAFLDGYNAVVDYIKENNSYDSEAQQGQAFFGESTARGVLNDLRNIISSQVSGLATTFDRLVYIGVESSGDGKLKLDADDFSEALKTDFDGVVSLFAGDDAAIDGIGDIFFDKIKILTDFSDGTLTLAQKRIETTIEGINDDIERTEFRIYNYEEALRKQFTGLETLLLTLNRQSTFLSKL